jgi:hypothetical protein
LRAGFTAQLETCSANKAECKKVLLPLLERALRYPFFQDAPTPIWRGGLLAWAKQSTADMAEMRAEIEPALASIHNADLDKMLARIDGVTAQKLAAVARVAARHASTLHRIEASSMSLEAIAKITAADADFVEAEVTQLEATLRKACFDQTYTTGYFHKAPYTTKHHDGTHTTKDVKQSICSRQPRGFPHALSVPPQSICPLYGASIYGQAGR